MLDMVTHGDKDIARLVANNEVIVDRTRAYKNTDLTKNTVERDFGYQLQKPAETMLAFMKAKSPDSSIVKMLASDALQYEPAMEVQRWAVVDALGKMVDWRGRITNTATTEGGGSIKIDSGRQALGWIFAKTTGITADAGAGVRLSRQNLEMLTNNFLYRSVAIAQQRALDSATRIINEKKEIDVNAFESNTGTT